MSSHDAFFDLLLLPFVLGSGVYMGYKAADKKGYSKPFLAVLGGAAYLGVRALRKSAK